MSSPSWTVGDSLKNWKFKKWLADHLSQPSSQPYATFEGSQVQQSITSMFPLERSKPNLACKVSIYLLQALQILVMLAVCVIAVKPILGLRVQHPDNKTLLQQLRANENHLYVGLVIWARAMSSLAYVVFFKIRNNFHYMANKIIQLASLVLFRVPAFSFLFPFLCLTCLIEYGSDVIYILCKQQRRGLADSRLNYSCYLARMLATTVAVITFNLIKLDSNTAMIVILLIVASVHCCYVAIDTLYSLATRNLLLALWAGVFCNVAYFLFLIYTPTIWLISFQINRWVGWVVAPIVSVGALITLQFSKSSLILWSFGRFQILSQDYYQLKNCQERRDYIWEAIRLLSFGPQRLQNLKQTVSKIDWVLKKYPHLENQTQRNRSQIRNNIYAAFYHKFTAHCYKILMSNFKQNEENKYLLIFFFNDISAEKMLLHLNKTDFYDIREGERIRRQHRSSDIAGKVNEMMKNQVEITQILKQYAKKLKTLAEMIGDDDKAVDLLVCQKIGKELIDLQQQILKFGAQDQLIVEKNRMQSLGSKTKGIKTYENPQILSVYSLNLLNLVRRQMLGSPELPKSKCEQKIQEISQIMNQEDSLIVISAESGEHGTILGINPAASKLTCYPEEELLGQSIDIILPHKISSFFSSIHQNPKLSMTFKQEDDYSFNNMMYIVKKNKHCSLCTISLRFLDCTMGKRWVVKLHDIQNYSPFLICDRDQNVIGFSQASLRVGMGFDLLGANLSQYLTFPTAEKVEDGHNKSKKESLSNMVPKRALIHMKQFITNNIEGPSNQSRLNEIEHFNQTFLKTQNHQSRNFARANGLECTILNKKSQQKEEDYYIIKIKEKKSIQKQQTYVYQPNQHQRILQIMKQKQNSISHDQKSQNENPKKKHRVSLSMMRNENRAEDVRMPCFQFHYDPSRHLFSNFPFQPGFEDWREQNVIESEEHTYLSRQLVDMIRVKTINCEDINELIYINGELQFRENKKLEQVHTCEIHPLHINHRYESDLSEKIIATPIEDKSKIYEVMGVPKGNHIKNPTNTPQQFYYLKEYKILMGLLAVFILLSCCAAGVAIFCVNDGSQQQEKKLSTMLLISERVQLYTNLANSMTSYILINFKLLLDSQYLTMRPTLTLADILGAPAEWLSLVKEVESKSSEINSIDLIQEKWKTLDLQAEIPQLDPNTDFNQLDATFVDLLQLQKLSEQHPQVDPITIGNVTQIKINPQLTTNALLVLQNLVQKIIPVDMFLITKTQQMYETTIDKRIKVISASAIVSLVVAVLITAIALCQLKQIKNQIQYNLELFTFFPSPSIRAFIGKLEDFDMKISDEKDLTSEIGIEKQSQAEFVEEELIFHKRKIKKNLYSAHFIVVCILLAFIALAFGFLAVLSKVTEALKSPTNLDYWFMISNSRLLQVNYEWQIRIINEGRLRLQQVNNYFKVDGFSSIPIESLMKSRKYTQYQTQNDRNFYSNNLTPDFQAEVSKFLDKNYCYADDRALNPLTICKGQITNFSVESLQNYIQLKRYSLEVLLRQSLDEKSYQKFQSLTNFFDKSNGQLNDERLLRMNKQIMQRELKRAQSQNYIIMTIGLLILLVLMALFSIGYVREVQKSIKHVFVPIQILVKCFPLLMLNRNQPFLNWYYLKKTKELR